MDTAFSDAASLVRAHDVHYGVNGKTSVLHYVACSPVECLAVWHSEVLPEPVPKHVTSGGGDGIGDVGTELCLALQTALPGFQRILLDGGRLSLTLCVGNLSDLLSAQDFQADEVHLYANEAVDEPVWDKWTVQALSRRCRRGTRVHLNITSPVEAQSAQWVAKMQALMQTAGFEWSTHDLESHNPAPAIQYNPGWTSKNTRSPVRPRTPPLPHTQRCAVIGGGLAGATIAHALALRGYGVTVCDAAPEPAAGASGLPVGVLVSHVSVDDSPRSRLSRVGVRLMLQHAQRLLRSGDEFLANGVLQITGQAAGLLQHNPNLQQQGWIAPGNGAHQLWHPLGGWIRPAALIRAWLQHPGIHWRGGAKVQRLERKAGGWDLVGNEGQNLLQADIVVIANAMGAQSLIKTIAQDDPVSPDLLDKLAALEALHGTVSHGVCSPEMSALLPPFAVNGSGSLVHTPGDLQMRNWFAGATYSAGTLPLDEHSRHHAENLRRLTALSPAIAAHLASEYAHAPPQAWTGTRCVTHDRLPMVGPVDQSGESGLWLNVGLGSRGLSLSALCAELLVAKLGNEPLPVEAKLARSLDAHRIHRKTLIAEKIETPT